MIFTNKYNPRELEELLVSKEKILLLKTHILERKPILVNGPTGCGKTSLAFVLAKQLNYEVLELNASDRRSKNNLESVLAPSIKEGSLFYSGRLILIDDVEAISNREDRGGLLTLINLISQTKWPIIITSTDIHDFKFSKLKSKCALVELDRIKDSDIFDVLKKICEKENILYDPLILKELAEKSKGDLRAAINDLQSLSSNKQIDSLHQLGEREREENILTVLKNIFKLNEIKKVINSFDDANVDLDEAALWLDENIPREYLEDKDLSEAYNNLSKADVFNGRIRKRQYWRFSFYRNFFLTAGISLAKSRNYLNYLAYKRTNRLLKLFWAKQKNLKKKEISKKIAEKTHCSQKKAFKDTTPFIQLIYRKEEAIEDLDLTEEEILWLRK